MEYLMVEERLSSVAEEDGRSAALVELVAVELGARIRLLDRQQERMVCGASAPARAIAA